MQDCSLGENKTSTPGQGGQFVSVCANMDAKQFPDQQLSPAYCQVWGGGGSAACVCVCVCVCVGLMAVFLNMWEKKKLVCISKSLKCTWHKIILSLFLTLDEVVVRTLSTFSLKYRQGRVQSSTIQ